MCGRYVTPDQAAIEREWDLRGTSSAQFVQKYLKTFNNTGATVKDYVPVIRDRGQGKELVEMQWSLIPEYANGEAQRDSQGRPLTTFNAKIETFQTSRTYSGAWQRGQRCLIPMRGFYEWQAQPPDWQRTIQFHITINDQELPCFAGLWDRSTKADGTVIETVTMITMPANELMQEIHNSRKRGSQRELLPENERRMPAILRKEDQEAWLTGTLDEAWATLKPYPSEFMVARPMSPPPKAAKPKKPTSRDLFD